MTTPRFRFLFFLVFLCQVPGLAGAACIVPGTATACEELVSGLPWPFIIHVKEEQPVRITYLNSRGIQQSNIYLKMFLEISEYGKAEEASEGFAQLCQQADPDMGLSYGWDLVMVRNKRIYHLHADCTLAEQHFNTMTRTLERMTGPSDMASPHSLLCRCGGGCKVAE